MASSLIVLTSLWPQLQSLWLWINEASSWFTQYAPRGNPQPNALTYGHLYVESWKLVLATSDETATVRLMATPEKMKEFLCYYCLLMYYSSMTQITFLIHVFTFPAAYLILLCFTFSARSHPFTSSSLFASSPSARGERGASLLKAQSGRLKEDSSLPSASPDLLWSSHKWSVIGVLWGTYTW